MQNKIKNTTFTLQQAIEAARTNLLECVPTINPQGTIPAGALKGFSEYLFKGGLSENQLSEMAYRLASYVTTYRQVSESDAPQAIKQIEETVSKRFANAAFISECEKKLASKGVPAARLQQLRLLMPKALIYLNFVLNNHFGPLTSETSKAMGIKKSSVYRALQFNCEKHIMKKSLKQCHQLFLKLPLPWNRCQQLLWNPPQL